VEVIIDCDLMSQCIITFTFMFHSLIHVARASGAESSAQRSSVQ
jgi:hypothetical protein